MQNEIRSIDCNIFDSDFTQHTGVATSISTAYACIKILAGTIASTKIEYINNEEEALPLNPFLDKIKGSKNTRFSFMNNILHDLFLNGNGYAQIKAGKLIYIPSSSVQIYITNEEEITHYYQVNHFGRSYKLYEEDIIHFKNISLDGINGISPIALHRSTFDSALALQSYQENFVQNSTNISGIISTPKKLNREAIANLRVSFNDKFSGTENAGKVPILTEGMTFNQMKKISPLDLDYLKTIKLSKENICEIFGIPISILGTSELKYSTSENMALQFQNYSIDPIQENIIQELTLKLGSGDNEFRFAKNSIKHSSSKEKADSVSLLVNTQILTPNEARKLYHLPAIEGGDELQKKENEVGDNINAPKDTKDTNPTAEKVTPPSKRSV